MIRYAFNTTGARMRSIGLPTMRAFSTSATLECKARVNDILEQLQSVIPTVCKTVKEKPLDEKVVRRNQLIWLVKHSLGKEKGISKVSSHELSWSAIPEEKGGKKNGDRVHVTVWPHLW